MSIHRGAEILFSSASGRITKQTEAAISNPSVPPSDPNSPLAAIQAACPGDPVATAFTTTVQYGTFSSDTYTAAQTTSGRYIVADSSNEIISFPT
jgi:hypothetical protein